LREIEGRLSRMAAGDFDQRISIANRDELGALATNVTRTSEQLGKLYRGLQESLDQQTATAEVLQIINASPGDLAPVFGAMLEKAMRVCEADFGLLASYDGECFHSAAMQGVPEAFRVSWQHPRRPSPGLALFRLTQGENVVHIADVAAD